MCLIREGEGRGGEGRGRSLPSTPFLASATAIFSKSVCMHRFISFRITAESSTSSMELGEGEEGIA